MDKVKISNGSKNITIGDIAEALNLSKTTVSRAMSGKGRISAETKKKVQDYVEEHNYKPNVIAKSLAKSKTYNIGVILPVDTNISEIPFFQSCLMGICEEAAKIDYDVVVTTAGEYDISLLKRLIQNQKVDGVILTRAFVNDECAKFLKKERIPFVVIGQNEDDSIIQIDSNHVAACKELTSILLMSGYKRLAFLVGNLNHIVNRNRYDGFMEAYKEAGELIDPRLIYNDMNSKLTIDRAVSEVIEQSVDCIVCSDDFICQRVLVKLEDNNYIIPRDIKIASFYSNIYLETHNPPVTAVNIDVKDLGKTAVNQLRDVLNGLDIPYKTWVDFKISLRKSTL